MDEERENRLAEIRERVGMEFLGLTRKALETLQDIMGDENETPSARVQAAGIILDRALGKPEENINVRNVEDSVEAAQERLEEIFLRIREGEEKD